jgi:hypothetical protein
MPNTPPARAQKVKTASSKNAFKTSLYVDGIGIAYESFTEVIYLEASCTAEYQPATPTERSLVDSIIH